MEERVDETDEIQPARELVLVRLRTHVPGFAEDLQSKNGPEGLLVPDLGHGLDLLDTVLLELGTVVRVVLLAVGGKLCEVFFMRAGRLLNVSWTRLAWLSHDAVDVRPGHLVQCSDSTSGCGHHERKGSTQDMKDKRMNRKGCLSVRTAKKKSFIRSAAAEEARGSAASHPLRRVDPWSSMRSTLVPQHE